MRISWLEPEIVGRIRAVLSAWNQDISAHFTPGFQVPPAPPALTGAGWPERRWARAAEHVARAERVAGAIRAHGLDPAIEQFGTSPHAVELATLIAAALQTGVVPSNLVVAVLRCAVDEMLVYGPHLQLLEQIGMSEPGAHEHTLAVYDEFCGALARTASAEPMWTDRVRAARDGLASFYVRCGRFEAGHTLFLERHRDEDGDILVALAATRAFLTAGEPRRAEDWLELGAERADTLGRSAMAAKLRAKRARLVKRRSDF